MSEPDTRPVGEDDLHAFVDGRLPPERRAFVAAWLDAHPEAADAVATDIAVRAHMRDALAPFAEAAIPARLRVANLRAARPRPRLRGLGLAAAALLCVAFGGAGGWALRGVQGGTPPRGEPATRDAVAAFRTYTVETVHPVEVRAEERPHLTQWLSKRVGRPVGAPDLTPFGFRLMGGRLLPAGPDPAAMLMYDDADGVRLTLYTRTGTAEGRTVFRFARDGDVAAFSWFDGGMAYVVTARTSEARLLGVAESVDAQAQGLPPPRP